MRTSRFGGRARIALATVVVAAAALALSALGPGGAHAATRPGARPGPVLDLGRGAAPTATAVQACFGSPIVALDCTSANPIVSFSLYSNGDSSDCVFAYLTKWGDGTKTPKTFPGGPDGSLLARFSHMYDVDDPQTWTVTVTSSVVSGDDCSGGGGTLHFTLLPKVGVGAVRFGPAQDNPPNNTPGLPVIKDDGPSFVLDHAWGPTSCDGIAAPPSYDYLNCASPVPSGTPAKVWPVIFARGDDLGVDGVVLATNGAVPSPQLTATATVTGSATATFTLGATPLTQTTRSGGDLLTATGLDFTGSMPSVPGKDTLTITWTVKDLASGLTVQTVTSTHPIYLTAGAFVPPTGQMTAAEERPYVTVLDTGVAAASGQTGAQNVFNSVWRAFTTLSVKHAILDPATGAVTAGPALTYYNDGFTTLSDGFDVSRNGCYTLPGLLHENTGHCGAWAQFLAAVLAYQNLAADATGLGSQTGPTGFAPGPAPAGGCSAQKCAYMLVGPSRWSLTGANAGGAYPYRDKLTVTPGGQVKIAGTEIAYAGTGPFAQGPVSTPPMWFRDGDHAIDGVTLPGGVRWVDPSYGAPAPPHAPFATVRAYEPSAIAGFAVVYKVESGHLTPLPATYSMAAIAAACTGATCWFQASAGS